MGCPRCAGTLYKDEDTYGRFLSCLNCGYLKALDHYDPAGQPDKRQGVGGPRRGRLKGMTAGQRNPRS